MKDVMPNPTDTPETIWVRIPSRLELLGLLDRVTDSLCERMDFDQDARARITMSVVEAGTNAIQHGHGRDPAKTVEIEFHLLPDALEIIVRDSGAGFDLTSVNGNVTAPEHLLDVRGRGIYIMRECMDTVEYSFSGTGTTCRLVKKRQPQPAHES